MTRSRRNLSITRLLATSDYRGKSAYKKGLKLLEDSSIFKCGATEAVSFRTKVLRRAEQAMEEGRGLRIYGQPSISNKDDAEELLRRLYILRESIPLT